VAACHDQLPASAVEERLVVLDTPGLNALGTEPELTLKMIPSAHAILFLLATDTGVTKSDLEIWQRYVQTYQTRRIAVLNKVDLLWDDLKTNEEIDVSINRQVEETCRLLELPRDHVIALSAQKALLARIRADDAMLKRSAIGELETLIATEIIPAKQEILRTAVVKEMGNMVEGSLQSVMAQLSSTQGELQELSKLSGKNRELAKTMLARLEKDRARLSAAHGKLQGLLRRRAQARARADGQPRRRAHRRAVRQELARHRGQLDHRRAVAQHEQLFESFTRQADKILTFASETRNFVDKVYQDFQEKYGFVNLTPPPLNLEKHILSMKGLKQNTERFCRDPVNVMTEKHFLVKKFYNGLVTEAAPYFSRCAAISTAG
jgi:hypothetical protein